MNGTQYPNYKEGPIGHALRDQFTIPAELRELT